MTPEAIQLQISQASQQLAGLRQSQRELAAKIQQQEETVQILSEKSELFSQELSLYESKYDVCKQYSSNVVFSHRLNEKVNLEWNAATSSKKTAECSVLITVMQGEISQNCSALSAILTNISSTNAGLKQLNKDYTEALNEKK